MVRPAMTDGADRAISLSCRLAHETGAPTVEPLHLFWALILDESRAAEYLIDHGVDREAVSQQFPLMGLHNACSVSSSDVPSDSLIPVDDSIFQQRKVNSKAVDAILSAARSQALQRDFHPEIGTEHLLWGLARVESTVSDFLQSRGIDALSLVDFVDGGAEEERQPIEVDFQIEWSSTIDNSSSDIDTDTMRIIDAAANRAREGIRVLEDFVRFHLDDRHLTERLKFLRHSLTKAMTPFGSERLLAARDTQQDVGTTISTQAERTRLSSQVVLQANFKRVQEALRTLEEFGKLVESKLQVAADTELPSEQFGQLRYDFYTLEKAVLSTMANRDRLSGCSIYLLLTRQSCHCDIEEVVRAAVSNGVGIVQLREKFLTDRKLIERGRLIRQWTRSANTLFIMNDRPDVAVLVDADGVHVGQDEMTVRQARRIVGPDRLIGVSTHSIEQARQAVLDGADYIGVGPIFSSTTKQFDELAGLSFLKQVAEQITLPWFAIGGINADNIQQVTAAGAERVAISAAICGSPQPALATAKLARCLNGHEASVLK